jgi:hypothetical protein
MDIPEKFPEVIRDFLADLTIAFPEYVYLWEVWQEPGADIKPLYEYCLAMYPERFFDILYQNEEVIESDSNMMFLPNIDFRMLLTAPGISENTKQAIWKYLQLILITIMGNVKSAASFGDTAGLFEGIEEEELQKKLGDTIEGLTDFFKGLSKDGSSESMEKAFEEMFESRTSDTEGASGAEASGAEASGAEASGTEEGNAMPNADDLHNHLKSLFDGKIGTLAKELAEEMSGEVMDMFDDGEAKETSDVLKKMMRNPKKIMDLVKKIGSKLDDKMKAGSISQEELMKEATEMMSKMKGGAGGKEFQDMMKNMMKTMGGSAGKGMFDMNRMTSMMGQNVQKERMRTKLEQRHTLEAKGSPNEFVFKMPGEEVQEKSIAVAKQAVTTQAVPTQAVPTQAPVMTDDWLEDIQSGVTKNPSSGGKKKKKGKK